MSEPIEQKARGKSERSGRWIYGVYMKHIARTPCVIGDGVRPEDIRHVILYDGFSDWNMPRNIEGEYVEPDTVGWYVGMRDKNGKEAYEGDIIRWTNDYSGKTYEREIVHDKEWNRYAVFMNGAESHGVNKYLGYPNGFEVIGNIYDDKTPV